MTTYNTNTGKDFEVPNTGNFQGVIVDVFKREKVQTEYGVQDRVTIVWFLNAVDSDGRPFRAISDVNAKISAIPGRKKSGFYELLEQIFGVPPGATFEDETLIGISRNLFIMKEKGRKDPTKWFGNIKGITPLTPDQTPMTVPAGFVRAKDKQQPGRSVSPAVIPQAVAVGDEQF
jgi:hypothetical protein